jgi:ABC-type dipeptide/oligopeptide/nickel transport system permease subunit
MSLIGGVVKSSTQRSGSRKPPRGVVAAGFVLLALAVVALWPSLVASYSPLETDASSTLQPPSAEHIFGTDQSGRDVFSRVVHGAQYSLAIGLGATGVALGLGLLLGVSAALGSRIVDGILSRFIDVLMAFPEFLLALVVIAVMGPGESSIPLAVAIAQHPPTPEWHERKRSWWPMLAMYALAHHLGSHERESSSFTSSPTSRDPFW